MNIGFDTIGNATLIVYDHGPLLVTDPWLSGGAYYGSWILSHSIPQEQMNSIQNCKFVWISHGHPDHLSQESLALLRHKTILLPDHVGKRIYTDLKALGYTVQVMKERIWQRLSDYIYVMCISDYNQDAILLVDIHGRLIVNTNDAFDHGWFPYVKKIIKNYKISFQLSLSGFGDVDMIHFFNEDGSFVEPLAAKKLPVGRDIALKLKASGCRYFIPFSSMHRYQREDSVWANQYVTSLSDYNAGFDSKESELLPAFIRWDCLKDGWEALNPLPTPHRVIDPKEMGDHWEDPLESSDVAKSENYFKAISHLSTFLDFINLRVGKKDNFITFNRKKFNKGVTFEAPRGSLMYSIEHEIFDDMLIGNFMKTTLHGKWGEDRLYPDFTPYVSKYGDNGRAKSQEELKFYFSEYRKRGVIHFLLHRIDEQSKNVFRKFVPKEAPFYQFVKKGYWFLKK